MFCDSPVYSPRHAFRLRQAQPLRRALGIAPVYKRRTSLWGAWIRVSCSSQHKADFRALSVAYRKALSSTADGQDAAKMATAKSLNRWARDAIRDGAVKGRAFGPRIQEVRRIRAQARSRAMVVAQEESAVAEGALALVDGVSGIGVTLRGLIAAARSRAIVVRKANDREDEQDAVALDWYAEHCGAALKLKVETYIPGASVSPVPVPHMNLLYLTSEGVAQGVGVCGVACHRSMSSAGLAARLEEQWGQMHRTLMDETCKPLGPQPPEARAPGREKLPLCRDVGFCLCTDKGLELYRWRNMALMILRTVCCPNSDMRQLLDDGYLVWRLRSHVAAVRPECEMGTTHERWYHLGFNLFSPWSLALHRMEQTEALPEGSQRERVYLKASLVLSRLVARVLSGAIWVAPSRGLCVKVLQARPSSYASRAIIVPGQV